MPAPISEHSYLSVRGRKIEVFVFGSGERTAMIMGGVHGDEQSGVEVVRSVQAALSQMPDGELDGLRVVLMPLANPDGCAANTRQNANGIDLNRNFPDKDFGTGEKSGSYFGGDIAASEPETKAILEVISSFNPYLIISLHAPLACVNYNGPSRDIAQQISELTGLPVTGDIGYPTPGSMGNYYGRDRNLPLITLELPKENVDIVQYTKVLLGVIGLNGAA